MLRRPDGTFNRDLAEFLDRKVSANTVPVDGVFSFDVVDRSTSLLNRIYRPPPPSPETAVDPQFGIIDLQNPLSTTEIVPVIIFFHGGSFAHSSANSAIYDTFCRRLVSICKAVVVSVNYRRSPENCYPSAYDDGWAALKMAPVGTSPTMLLTEQLNRALKCWGIFFYIRCLVAKTGPNRRRNWTEKYFVTIQDRDWYWRAYLPKGEDRDHPACNPFGPRGISLKGLTFPKSLVVVAGLDLVQDWQLAYVEGLKNAGQEVKLLFLKQATIGFYFLPNNDHFYSLMEEINSFVNPNC
ncbi:alpha/beta-Hydrolases superfamily protein [Actinidia rufa]|uniref:Alpha/beta-Hydrolases superfamily protein n=1 Tax=Actinidia rufa TaxID=165716 RepID=A0A7J0H9R5_9ERIC|nr:alpha/beta-Hydrolases superfamily protein [Actinidia rufa]